jgi:hypothetical protein
LSLRGGAGGEVISDRSESVRAKGTHLGLDKRHHTALRDHNVPKQLVQLLVVPDRKLQVPRHNALLLVVARRVPSKLEDLGSKVLEHRSEVYCRQKSSRVRDSTVDLRVMEPTRCTSTHTLRVVALLQQTVHTAHRELKPRARRTRLGLAARLARRRLSRLGLAANNSFARHVDEVVVVVVVTVVLVVVVVVVVTVAVAVAGCSTQGRMAKSITSTCTHHGSSYRRRSGCAPR